MIGHRVAGAPISWGVCEVPGWGYQLPAERVLAEMRAVGLAATEFGPEGFLPADAAQRRALLDKHRLTAVGGFVPVVLHEAGHDPWPRVNQALHGFVAAGAGILVLAAATGRDGYDSRPDLDDSGWRRLFWNLDRIRVRAAELGITACLHPH
ncbi:MAG: inosose dehydratase, partial [Catenulispora sp.]